LNSHDHSVLLASSLNSVCKLLSSLITIPYFCYTLLLPILDGVRMGYEKEMMKAKKEEEREREDFNEVLFFVFFLIFSPFFF
jgi:hypothetical protein